MSLLRDRKVWQKLAILGSLFCVPIVVLLYLLVSEKNIAIDFAVKETEGTAYLRPLRRLLEHVPEHARVARLPGAEEELSRSEARINEALAILDGTQVAVGESLKTGEKLATLKQRWQAVKNAPSEGKPGQNEALHDELLAGVRTLIGDVGNNSNLILDPDLDSFYVMDSVVVKLPEGLDLLGKIAAFGGSIAGRGSLTADEKTQLIVMRGLLGSFVSGLSDGMAVALRENPAGNLRPALGRPLEEALAAFNAFLAATDKGLLTGGGVTVDPKEYAGLAEKARVAGFGLWDRGTDELDGLLRARINGFKNRKHLSLGFVAIAIAVTILFVVLIARSITGTLSQGVGLAKAIAGGRLGNRLRGEAVLRKDELGELMRALDDMSATIAEFVGDVGSSSEKVGAAAEQLSSSSSRIAQGAEDQSSKVSALASATEEMTVSIRDVARSATSVAEAASAAHGVAEGGGTLVGRTSAGMQRIAKHVRDSSEVIGVLESRSREIGSILEVIEDIADQTNLLALNAAIEAARAGQQGKGFAVVADEVRKLAERTGKATQKISETVVTIQTEAARAVSSMERSLSDANEGARLASEAGEALAKIVADVGKVRTMVAQIAVAAEQQSAVAQQIGTDIGGVAGIAEETSTATGQIVEAAMNLKSLSLGLGHTANKFQLEVLAVD